MVVDPYGEHEARYFSNGWPTSVVRDGEEELYHEPPAGTSGFEFGQLTPAPSQPSQPYVPRRSRLAPWIMAITGVAAAAALVVVLDSAISARPLPGLQFALVPAVPVLIVGQLWTIVVMRRLRREYSRPRFPGGTIWLLFSPLPGRAALTLFVVFVAGWLSGLTAPSDLTNGVPSPTDNPSCPYMIDNQGSVTCISKATYLLAEAAQQRLVAGVMLVFFAFHFGAAWSQVLRDRQPSTGAA
jgi:hypothetical protein